MDASKTWQEAKSRWYNGHTGDALVLKHTANYLEATADWIAVRNFLITMAMSKQQILDWFGTQDFPDFRQAVDEGWGWPKELEEI